MSAPASAPPRTAVRPGLVLLLVCVAQFVLLVDDTIVNVALPSIRGDLGFSESGLSWVANAYFLTFGGFLLVGGRAADLLGRRRMFVAGLALFALASTICAIAPSGGVLVAGRGVQGLVGALLSPAAFSILLTTFAAQPERNRALGAWAALSGVGAATGLVLGGALVELASWRWVFLINVPVLLCALAAVPRVLPASIDARERRAADVAGATLATSALLLLVFTIVETNGHGWGSARTLLGLAGAAALAAGFLARQRTAPEPLIPRALLRVRRIVAADALAFVAATGFFAMFFFLTLYMQSVKHWSALHTGLAYLPFSGMVTVTSGVLSRAIGHRSPRGLLVAGPLTIAVALWWMSRLEAGSSYAGALLPALLVGGLGIGLLFVPLLSAATGGVEDDDSGLASALVTTCQQVGAAVGIAVLVTIASHATHDRLHAGAAEPSALVEGFQRAFVVAAILMASSALLGVASGGRSSRRARDGATRADASRG
jgi:EmrB/QacA subfamily drug resistance transporter